MSPASRFNACILDAAITVFLREGYERTSMGAIAAEAGVARRTVFNAFDNKEGLFRSAMTRFWSGMPIALLASEASEGDVRSSLRRMATAIAEFWSQPAAVALARLVITEGVRFPELAADFLGGGKIPAFQKLVGYLDTMHDRGLLAINDTDLAARQFVGLINEPLLWLRVLGLQEEHPPERRSYVVDEAVQMFLDRYNNQRPPGSFRS